MNLPKVEDLKENLSVPVPYLAMFNLSFKFQFDAQIELLQILFYVSNLNIIIDVDVAVFKFQYYNCYGLLGKKNPEFDSINLPTIEFAEVKVGSYIS